MVALSVATVALFPVPSSAAAIREATLTAAAGTADDKFGVSVSIFGDTAVVGAPDEGGMGAAYVFTRSAGTWTERATLVAPVRVEGGKFGYEVAIDGDTVVVGAPQIDENVPGPGAAHVFVGSGDTWLLQATLTASDAQLGDAFGIDVAVSGDTVVAGAAKDDVGAAADQGSAYVFTRSGDVWSEQKLTARDGAGGDEFGDSVAVSGDSVVVGAWAHDVGLGIGQGSAHVFTRSGSTWTEQAKLTAGDGAAGDGFGQSVAISHDMVVVGTTADDLQGSAYVFERDGESWAQQAKLVAPDGSPLDQFGRSVATSRDTVVVGAHFHDSDGPLIGGAGSVYVFDRVADGWSEPTKLTEAGAGIFGNSVGMSGHTVIAGAGFTKVGENPAQGAAYVYRLRPPTQVVGIDVKPGDDRNRVRISGKEEIAVAVLGTPAFDATTVDPSSACFGDAPPPGGTTSYQQPAGADADCTEAHGRGHIQDVDGDGDLDMLLHFETAQTGFDHGDTTATLTGMTTTGGTFVGSDSIRTVP